MAEQKGLVVAWTGAATAITGDITAIDQAIDALTNRGQEQVQKRAQDARDKLVKALGTNVDGTAAIAAAVAYEKESTEVDTQDKARKHAISRLLDLRRTLVEHPSDSIIKSLEDALARLNERITTNHEEKDRLVPLLVKAQEDLATAKRARETLLAADRHAPFTAEYMQSQHGMNITPPQSAAATRVDEKKKAE